MAKKKPYHQMTDEELKKRLFPAHVRKHVKKLVAHLDTGTPKTRKPKAS